MAPPRNPQELPTREANIFRKMGRCYENRQYKKALAYSKDILGTCPNHGETLSMRGLMLASMNKRAEAKEFIVAGLRQNLQSFVCWQVFGYFQRLEGNYSDAIKAYRNALKWEKDNLTILRDLASLEIQTRDFAGYKDSKYKILMAKPGQRMSWIGYAIACHLSGDLNLAMTVLREFDKIEQTTTVDSETSQLLFYENQLLREAGRFEDALEHLRKHSNHFVDITLLLETHAQILFELGRYDDAFGSYKELAVQNPQHPLYAQMLVKCADKTKGFDALQALTDLAEQFPSSLPLKRTLLALSDADTYGSRIGHVLKALLSKGTPAVFKSFHPTDPEKALLFERSLMCLIDEFEADTNSPTALFWGWYTLAELRAHQGDSTAALALVDKVLTHTPTFVDAYLLRARILKRLGSVRDACRWVIEAQSLDTADKYLNSKCTRYLLRCDAIETAEEMIGKFIKVDKGNTFEYLFEIQCFWYVLACGAAFYRRGDSRRALQCFHDVLQHYAKYKDENEFDFHTYCLRKATIPSYVETIHFHDNVCNNRHCIRAALLASEVYLLLSDQRAACASTAKHAGGSPEKSRLENEVKNMKVGNTTAKDKQNKSSGAQSQSGRKGEFKIPEDTLSEVASILTVLLTADCSDPDIIRISLEVFLRKKWLLPALRCLISLRRRSDPLTNVFLLQFRHAVNCAESLDGIEMEIVDSILKDQFDTQTAIENEEIEASLMNVVDDKSESLKARFLALKALWLMKMPSYRDLSNSFVDGVGNSFGPDICLKTCEGVYKQLDAYGMLDEDQMCRLKAICRSRFYRSDLFNDVNTDIPDSCAIESLLTNEDPLVMKLISLKL